MSENIDKYKRIYVREEDHKRFKAWAYNNGLFMSDALGELMDRVEAGKQKHDKRQP